MNETTALVNLGTAESDRIARYFRSLPPEAWDRETACDRWTVADVVAHLARGAMGYADSVRRGLADEPPTPAPPGPISPARIAQDAIDFRTLLGPSVLGRFEEASAQLAGQFASMRPQDFQKVIAHRLGRIPLEFFLRMRLQELCVHEWDICSRLEAEAHLSAQALPYLVDHMKTWLPRCFRKGEPLPQPVRYHFQVTPPVARTVAITVSGDACQVAAEKPPTSSQPDVTFTCDPETFVLLAMGRVDQQTAVRVGKLRLQGDPGMASRFWEWFKPL